MSIVSVIIKTLIGNNMGFKSQHCEMEFCTFLTLNFIQNETAFVEMTSTGFTLLLKIEGHLKNAIFH